MREIVNKYRIKKITFPTAKTVYIAQYKILGIWMNMSDHRGYFLKDRRTYCETMKEAQNRIGSMISDLKRAGEIPRCTSEIIYNLKIK